MASINTDEWQAELDRLMANVGPKVIPKEGFTLNDVMNRYDKKASSALRFIKALIASGQVVEIGVRPGYGKANVYAVVKDQPKK